MAPAGGKVSPTASNAPGCDDMSPSVCGAVYSAGGSTTSGTSQGARTSAQGVYATLGMIRV